MTAALASGSAEHRIVSRRIHPDRRAVRVFAVATTSGRSGRYRNGNQPHAATIASDCAADGHVTQVPVDGLERLGQRFRIAASVASEEWSRR
jgi:hypothetical protein